MRPGGRHSPPGRPELRDAAHLALSTLQRSYGERFLRELRAAGLEGLLVEPSVRGPTVPRVEPRSFLVFLTASGSTFIM